MNHVEEINLENKSVDEIINIQLSYYKKGINISNLISLELLNTINKRCVHIIINQKPEIWKLIPIEKLCEAIRPLPIEIKNSIPIDIWNYGLICETNRKKIELESKKEIELLFLAIDNCVSKKLII
jgi:hypothetical protein